MFVKVSDLLTVNTDNVTKIAQLKNETIIYFTVGEPVAVQPAAGAFLLDLLEVSQALDFNPQPETYKADLTTRLAQTLRDSQPYGATIAQLTALLNEAEDAVFDALVALELENVVKRQEPDGNGLPLLWFHASHAPRPPLVKTHYSANGTGFCEDASSGVTTADSSLVSCLACMALLTTPKPDNLPQPVNLSLICQCGHLQCAHADGEYACVNCASSKNACLMFRPTRDL